MARCIEVEIDDNTGVLKFYGARVVLSQENVYSKIQKFIEGKDARLARVMMYETGEQTTREAVSRAEKAFIAAARSIDKRKLIEKLLLLALERGFGLIRLGSFDYSTGKGTVFTENSVIARTYGKSKEPVCFLTAGVLAGAVGVVYTGDFVCREKRCQATGAPYCEFYVTPCTASEREKFIAQIK